MNQVSNGHKQTSSWLIERASSEFRFTEPQVVLIERIDRALGQSNAAKRAKLLTEQLLHLPTDPAVLIAGYAFFGVAEGVLEERSIDCSESANLLATLLLLSRADSAATTSALLQVRRNRRQSENVRRMLVAMIDDPRVVVLKMAERLVRIHPAEFDGSDVSKQAAREALHFYAPLASRLGIWQLKWVLEDFAFRCLQPESYSEIASQFQDRRSAREELVSKIQSDLRWRLGEVGIVAEIVGRAKNIYGIYRKMKEKELAFNDVHDVLAIRVIVSSVSECYQVLGIVHAAWPHIANEFDDYIANPKSNGYRSLHTAVYGPMGRVLEVQIRTPDMHVDSELGVCSHWRYKGDGDASLEDKSIDWMREVLNWHDALEFVEPTDAQLLDDVQAERKTYVATPQQHIVDLEAGSTALDFAFKVHTDIGLHCIGALVDGEEVALNTVLKTGQTVEILTQSRGTPQREWLDPDLLFYKTSRTREHLRSYFQNFDRQYNARAGRDWIQQEIERLNLKLTPEEAVQAMGVSSAEELYIDVALGSMKARQMLIEIARFQAEASEFLEENSAEKSVMHIHITALDRKNLARDITREIADLNVNIVNFQLGAPTLNGPASIDVWVQVRDLSEASLVIVNLRRLHRVSDARLVSPDQ